MILSESEKNRIRGLHRAASVIKEPLNEMTYMKKAANAVGLGDYIKGKEGLVPDALQKKAKEMVKLITPQEKSKIVKSGLSSFTDNFSKWMDGEYKELIPGDQSELKKKAVSLAKNIYSSLGGS